MEREIVIKGFVQLGKLMNALGNDQEWPGFEIGTTEDEYLKLKGIIGRQFFYNGWFTKENVQQSLLALSEQLKEETLLDWLEL